MPISRRVFMRTENFIQCTILALGEIKLNTGQINVTMKTSYRDFEVQQWEYQYDKPNKLIGFHVSNLSILIMQIRVNKM